MKEVKTVGVVGFGVMGALIGLNSAMSGYRVVFKEINDDGFVKSPSLNFQPQHAVISYVSLSTYGGIFGRYVKNK